MMDKRPLPDRPTAYLLLYVLVCSGCATRLAPAYDEHIVVGLTNANTQAMTLFAAFSAGAKQDQFAAYKDRYDGLIGSLHALEMQIHARPAPATPLRLAADFSRDEVDASGPPVEPIQGMARTITTTRDVHGANGLTATEVEAMRRQWMIYADQALTYEAYLER
ncbi:hypothetical protein [Thiocapsa roseopersicina]|uniref:Uncharacterized protein n=1 Tax=Thiocapsa roseopersicina TaxID=1058 RepID=A0A1H3B793_THIRO|nr:hypothetical protein [Thiocapsa roseopersicina]SDX37816.1 hypothetical protein SAMN05421783_12332 [Thiocapsa roseopersicina]